MRQKAYGDRASGRLAGISEAFRGTDQLGKSIPVFGRRARPCPVW